MIQTHKLDTAVVAAVIKAREIGVKMLASDCEKILSAAIQNVELDYKDMVNRFLGWKLPTDFYPDAGISFQREYNVEYMASLGKPPMVHEPSGTNLFHAEQAETMFKHCVKPLITSAPEVGEAVAWFAKRRNEHSGLPFPAVWMPITKEQYESDEFNIPQLELKVHYSTPQTDRTAQLERQLAERGEEIERLQSYEQGLNGVIAWMKERGLYWQGDHQQEGADFAAILTEHEQQVSAQSDRKLEADKARMLDALRKAAETTYSDKLHVDWIALIADMEAKG